LVKNALLRQAIFSFNILEKVNRNIPKIIPERKAHGIELRGERFSLKIPDEKMVYGLYHATHSNYWSEVDDLEKDIDYKFEFFMDYFRFNVQFSEAKEFIHEHYDKGHLMLISLQPTISPFGGDPNGNVVMMDLLNGDYDQYILDWAYGLKELNEPVFLRYGNEMNGDWAQWCAWYYGLDPDLFIMSWVRVHTIFEMVEAENVLFVWNPHDRTYPDYDWQVQYLYYPGDNMVDWIGLTAYNNGVTRPAESWRNFDDCYKDIYIEYRRRYSDKPFMITEFACNEIGGSKAEWIETGLESLCEDYPNIWIAVWWNGVDDTWIYDIDSSDESTQAFKKAMDHPNVVQDPIMRR
jgi:hypothetical protein